MENDVILKHNGYVGNVEYSTLDECYYGYILNIFDMITYESDTIEGLFDNFKEAVEDYIKIQTKALVRYYKED